MKSGRVLVALLAVVLVLAGCAQYQLVEGGGKVTVGDGFRVDPRIPWSMAKRDAAYFWTVDGPNLEQLMFFPGIKDGEPLLAATGGGDAKAMPVFHETMTLMEAADLLEATMTRFNCHQYEKRNLRPASFGGLDGFRFDFSCVSKAGLEYRGVAAGAIKGAKLYLVVFTGTTLHYFDKHAAVVEQIFTNIEVL